MSFTLYNAALPALGQTLRQPEIEELNSVHSCFKYAGIDFVKTVYANHPYISLVLNSAPIKHQHKYVLVDLKLHKLAKGQYPCIPGWHLDGSENKLNLPKKRENFALFVTGFHALTQFVQNSFIYNVDDVCSFSRLSKQVGDYAKSAEQDGLVKRWTIPSCTFAMYDDTYLHTCVETEQDEVRLLIRITESDIIQPRNTRFDPSYHGSNNDCLTD